MENVTGSFNRSSAPSELSLRGGVLETEMGQFFRLAPPSDRRHIDHDGQTKRLERLL